MAVDHQRDAHQHEPDCRPDVLASAKALGNGVPVAACLARGAAAEVLTPVPNDTFLNGLTRQRVIKLLRAEGFTVTETSLTVEHFRTADEIFTTGNIARVMPVARLDERHFEATPVADRVREIYWDYALSCK